MSGPAPLRFLAIVLGGWIGFRLIALAPDWGDGPAPGAPASPSPASPQQAEVPADRVPPAVKAADFSFGPQFPVGPRTVPGSRGAAPRAWTQALAAPRVLQIASVDPLVQRRTLFRPYAGNIEAVAPSLAPPIGLALGPPHAQSPRTGRWSGSAWLFVRRGDAGPDLAPGGTLGGSQAGARLAYRIDGDSRRPLALSARAYVPLDRPEGAEAAVGLDWRPLAGIPIHLLAERRERIGRDGRSDFALSLYGGGERRLLGGRVRVEAYGQAGVVGASERDLFADGSARASIRVGPAEAGAGLWGGAQPDAARLDAGPQASASVTVGGMTLRASAEWRFRIAGDAAPGSGPAFTISTGF